MTPFPGNGTYIPAVSNDSRTHAAPSLEMDKQHESRGLGEGSRLSFDLEKLKSLGWEVKRRESRSSGTTKVNFSYKTPDGKTLKSAKDVEKFLRETGVFFQVAVESDERIPEASSSAVSSVCEDPDFQPPNAKVLKKSTSNNKR